MGRWSMIVRVNIVLNGILFRTTFIRTVILNLLMKPLMLIKSDTQKLHIWATFCIFVEDFDRHLSSGNILFMVICVHLDAAFAIVVEQVVLENIK